MKIDREHYILNSRGKKVTVILPLARYRRLIEDLHDLAVIAARRHEIPIGFDEVKRRLNDT